MRVVALVLMLFVITLAKEVPFTQEDRDRIRNVELKVERLEEGQKHLQKQIEELKRDTQRQFDELRTFLYWGFGILFGGMGILIGFVIWDRRTAVEPVARKIKEIEEGEEKLEKVMKKLAKRDPEIEKILKEEGLA
ncbi:hypothetical protein IAE16_01860 [Hydrogenobacter sp. T-2]|uniref:hypothetical protein n=1 Tax=Pampinifervens diazotrophicum TaxID=1632018 RepID=UPI002B262384|nr:hypothetical protein [Hydrogenobacter sp. T-2]WPM32437.1 hypothetical protein IAE16_01860 [Hydrogenobacter sp. T-2]